MNSADVCYSLYQVRMRSNSSTSGRSHLYQIVRRCTRRKCICARRRELSDSEVKVSRASTLEHPAMPWSMASRSKGNNVKGFAIGNESGHPDVDHQVNSPGGDYVHPFLCTSSICAYNTIGGLSDAVGRSPPCKARNEVRVSLDNPRASASREVPDTHVFIV